MCVKQSYHILKLGGQRKFSINLQLVVILEGMFGAHVFCTHFKKYTGLRRAIPNLQFLLFLNWCTWFWKSYFQNNYCHSWMFSYWAMQTIITIVSGLLWYVYPLPPPCLHKVGAFIYSILRKFRLSKIMWSCQLVPKMPWFRNSCLSSTAANLCTKTANFCTTQFPAIWCYTLAEDWGKTRQCLYTVILSALWYVQALLLCVCVTVWICYHASTYQGCMRRREE